MFSAVFCLVNLLVASPCLDTDVAPGISLVHPVEELVPHEPAVESVLLARTTLPRSVKKPEAFFPPSGPETAEVK